MRTHTLAPPRPARRAPCRIRNNHVARARGSSQEEHVTAARRAVHARSTATLRAHAHDARAHRRAPPARPDVSLEKVLKYIERPQKGGVEGSTHPQGDPSTAPSLSQLVRKGGPHKPPAAAMSGPQLPTAHGVGLRLTPIGRQLPDRGRHPGVDTPPQHRLSPVRVSTRTENTGIGSRIRRASQGPSPHC